MLSAICLCPSVRKHGYICKTTKIQDDLWGFVLSINKLVGASFMQTLFSGQESELPKAVVPDESSQKGDMDEKAKG